MLVAGVACGGGLSSMSVGVRRLVVGYVVRERVNGWKVRVVVENLAVCRVEWPGFCWLVWLWG